MMSMIANNGEIIIEDLEMSQTFTVEKLTNQLLLNEVLSRMISDVKIEDRRVDLR